MTKRRYMDNLYAMKGETRPGSRPMTLGSGSQILGSNSTHQMMKSQFLPAALSQAKILHLLQETNLLREMRQN